MEGTAGTQTEAGKGYVIGDTTSNNGLFGQGGQGAINDYKSGIMCGAGGGFYGGAAGYDGAGGGSGYISSYLKGAQTTTSTHTGNGSFKITLLTQ